VQCFQSGHLFPAGRAPGRPHVEQHHVATQIGKRNAVPSHAGGGVRGSRLANHRGTFTRFRAAPREEGQSNQPHALAIRHLFPPRCHYLQLPWGHKAGDVRLGVAMVQTHRSPHVRHEQDREASARSRKTSPPMVRVLSSASARKVGVIASPSPSGRSRKLNSLNHLTCACAGVAQSGPSRSPVRARIEYCGGVKLRAPPISLIHI
jgi:hypothetical protein